MEKSVSGSKSGASSPKRPSRKQEEQKKRQEVSKVLRKSRELNPPVRAFGRTERLKHETRRTTSAKNSSSRYRHPTTASLASLAMNKAEDEGLDKFGGEKDMEFEQRRKDTEKKQMRYLLSVLMGLQGRLHAKAERELSSAWRTVFDAEEEAVKLTMKADHVQNVLDIHARIVSLDKQLERARSSVIALSAKHLTAIEELGTHCRAHVTLAGRSAPKWDSSDEGTARLIKSVSALDEVLSKLATAFGGLQHRSIHVNSGIATSKYRMQRQLNEMQTAMMADMKGRLEAAQRAKSKAASAKRSPVRSPARSSRQSSPYVSPYASPRRGTPAKASSNKAP